MPTRGSESGDRHLFYQFTYLRILNKMFLSSIHVPIKVISYIVLPCNHEHRLSFWLPLCLLVSMLTCADLLQKTKCLTKCLKNLSQLRWLALRPLIQLNRQTASLALKGETKHSRLLCVVLAVISILTSRLHSLVGTWSAFFLSLSGTSLLC